MYCERRSLENREEERQGEERAVVFPYRTLGHLTRQRRCGTRLPTLHLAVGTRLGASHPLLTSSLRSCSLSTELALCPVGKGVRRQHKRSCQLRQKQVDVGTILDRACCSVDGN